MLGKAEVSSVLTDTKDEQGDKRHPWDLCELLSKARRFLQKVIAFRRSDRTQSSSRPDQNLGWRLDFTKSNDR